MMAKMGANCWPIEVEFLARIGWPAAAATFSQANHFTGRCTTMRKVKVKVGDVVKAKSKCSASQPIVQPNDNPKKVSAH